MESLSNDEFWARQMSRSGWPSPALDTTSVNNNRTLRRLWAGLLQPLFLSFFFSCRQRPQPQNSQHWRKIIASPVWPGAWAFDASDHVRINSSPSWDSGTNWIATFLDGFEYARKITPSISLASSIARRKLIDTIWTWARDELDRFIYG